MIESHPGKPLEQHIKGVLTKCKKNSDTALSVVAVLFHDLGKLNPNFQKKLKGIKTRGYSNHSYLSVIVFFSFLLNNEKLTSKFLNAGSKENFRILIWQLVSIVAHHHGNLPDFSNILSDSEIQLAGNFVQDNVIEVSPFIEEKLNTHHQHFALSFNLKQINQLSHFDYSKHGNLWQQAALANFMETQFTFAALIEADKRDASKNEQYIFLEKMESSSKNIFQKLQQRFAEIDNATEVSALNKLRTNLRKEAVANLQIGINKGARIFSLPAPTGSGKTFTLLAIAKEIQSIDSKLGIIYSLPFLSITDQVQQIVEELGIECLPISSRSENKELEEAQKNYETNPTQENLEQLIKLSFSENTFDHPFILTTFVQFFETLVSNKNSTLLKLPNFCNRIFLIDEVQALPPRLYIFFTALLDTFCRQYNSYAILSTGTMPKFTMPEKTYFSEVPLKIPSSVFKSYSRDCVFEVINPMTYFEQDVFNRYKIDWIGDEELDFNDLIEHISKQTGSCLIILNTILDTKYLFEELKQNFENVVLLNTHFTAEDRTGKINSIKQYLKNKEQVVVVSTQLIEAGVDVDFPIVYRDLCPLPSLVQSAGRCNRNKSYSFGQVYLFQLINKEGKKSSELVYRKEAAQFLKFCKQEIINGTLEKDLFGIQSRFFEKIKDDLTIGEFVYDSDKFGNEKCYNFLDCINKAEFEKAGRFKLIPENKYGEEYQYFIPIDEKDKRYEKLIIVMEESLKAKDFTEKSYHKICMGVLLKAISKRLVTVRIKKNETAPSFSNCEEYFGIRVLSDLSKYSQVTGLNVGVENCIL